MDEVHRAQDTYTARQFAQAHDPGFPSGLGLSPTRKLRGFQGAMSRLIRIVALGGP